MESGADSKRIPGEKKSGFTDAPVGNSGEANRMGFNSGLLLRAWDHRRKANSLRNRKLIVTGM
jgi:hypothetical protein